MGSCVARLLRALGSIVALGVMPGSAFCQAGAPEKIEQILDAIAAAQVEDGPRSPDLIRLLAELGTLYEAEGDYALATAALAEARSVVRANYGLHTLEQLPLMQQALANQRALGNMPMVQALEEELLELADRHPDDLRTVAIHRDAGERRLDEYGPFRDPALGGGHAADYLTFVVDTVKPLVDATFRTTGERDRTATIGSSMGGLVSLYAFFARPDVFGLAGAFSPSIGFGRGAMVRFLLEAPRVPGRIYLDVGARERMVPLVHEARNILIEKGYRTGRDLLFVEDDGGAHDEASWARRLPRALRFLLR